MFMQLRARILNNPHGKKYQALMFYSALLHVLHMQELIETQGMHAFRSYMERLKEKESKSARMLLGEKETEALLELAQREEEHPKLKLLTDLLTKLKGKKCIVFAQYRDQISLLERELQKHGFTAQQFVGKRQGYTRTMQEETIQRFRDGKFDVLVASSIGEEGLDIPSVDAVIFYEPIPSEIRSIQRKGRAARLKEGEIYILMTHGTRDESYHWASNRKDKKMREIVQQIQRKMQVARGEKPAARVPQGQMKLVGF
jgi:Fanconi anemia group M protein